MPEFDINDDSMTDEETLKSNEKSTSEQIKDKEYIVNDSHIYGKKTRPVTKQSRNIGIDTDDNFLSDIVESINKGELNEAELESFSSVSQSRDLTYQLIDNMSSDNRIAAILETYAEDATEYADNGNIVWVASDDPEVSKHINYLLESMNINKNIYKWTFNLIKYGDLYLRLYRQSDIKDNLFDDGSEEDKTLNENVNINYYGNNDKYSHYVEMVNNPAEMFELTRFGKSYAYIQANVTSNPHKDDQIVYNYYRYFFKKNDVNIFPATEFVHVALEDDCDRYPEEVNIFLSDEDYDKNQNALRYKVRKGQSILSSNFRVWRQLQLLESSVMLNRLTKSAVIRIVQVACNDMPKEKVRPHLQNLKRLIEQKVALQENQSMNEYTNSGPIENTIYIPTFENSQGQITLQEIGGDTNITGLADLEYFKNKLYAGLKIPKQYFNENEDSTGFNGGTSLTLQSSRYAKSIKKIQNALIQGITDIINLMLIDSKLDKYINKFTIKMLPPTTQEELDRRENISTKVGIIRDVMDLVSDIPNDEDKLKILKTLLSDVISDQEVIDVLQESIEQLEQEAKAQSEEKVPAEDEDFTSSDRSFSEDSLVDMDFENSSEEPQDNEELLDDEMPAEDTGTDETLPNPNELDNGNLDFSDNTQF